jgi:hypothetical protein
VRRHAGKTLTVPSSCEAIDDPAVSCIYAFNSCVCESVDV